MNVSDFNLVLIICLRNVQQNLKLTSDNADLYHKLSVCAVWFGSTLIDKIFLSHFGVQGHISTYQLPKAKIVLPAHHRKLI